MMPGISLDGGTFDRDCFPKHKTKQSLLDQNGDQQDDECERRRSQMRLRDFAHRLDDNPTGGQQEESRDYGGGQWFGFAMSVGMVLVGGRRRDHQPAPNNQRTENI